MELIPAGRKDQKNPPDMRNAPCSDQTVDGPGPVCSALANVNEAAWLAGRPVGLQASEPARQLDGQRRAVRAAKTNQPTC